jgi:ubiquinone/menaquinone biosynthesis C-methylase UbiE
MIIDKNRIEANRQKVLERKNIYKQYGYDQDASRNFILEKCLPISGIVLEIGTGKGYMTVLLAKNAERIYCVDKSEEEHGYARLNAASENVLDKIEFINRDAGKLPFPDKKFDLVVSVNAFHHFEKPFSVLAEMIRVCRSKILVADFNKEGLATIRRVHKEEGREHEEKCGDFSIVGQYIKEHGFAVNKYEGFGQSVYAGERNK